MGGERAALGRVSPLCSRMRIGKERSDDHQSPWRLEAVFCCVSPKSYRSPDTSGTRRAAIYLPSEYCSLCSQFPSSTFFLQSPGPSFTEGQNKGVGARTSTGELSWRSESGLNSPGNPIGITNSIHYRARFFVLDTNEIGCPGFPLNGFHKLSV
jgi:hypothetical protein